MVSSNAVGGHTQREIGADPEANGYLPGLYAILEKSIR